MAETIDYESYVENGTAGFLMESTSDAMNNIFDVKIRFPWDKSLDDSPEASYRVQDFEPPTPDSGEYKVVWHGIEVTKMSSSLKLERKLKLKFRVDATMVLYNKLKTWERVSHDVNMGSVANKASALGTIVLIAPGGEYNATSASWNEPQISASSADSSNAKKGFLDQLMTTSTIFWAYGQVACKKVSEPKFEQTADGKPLVTDCEFLFGNCYYPFYAQKS